MANQDVWNRFYTTGNIEDYLEYVNLVRAEANNLEKNRNGNCDKSDGLQRERPSY